MKPLLPAMNPLSHRTVLHQSIKYEQILDDIIDAEVDVVEGEKDEDIVDLEKSSEAPVTTRQPHLGRCHKEKCFGHSYRAVRKSFRVRYRVDGVLYEIMNPHSNLRMRSRVVSRLWPWILQKDIAQDGRIKIKIGGRVDAVSILPTLFAKRS